MPEITWQTEEFEYHPKGKGWYGGVILLALLLWLLAWYLKSWLMGIVVGVALGLILRVGQTKPRQISITINDQALKVGERFFSWDKIKGFGLVKTPVGLKVNFLSSARFVPTLTFNLPQDKVPLLKEILKDKVPELEMRGEDLIDKLIRFLKI